MSIPTSNIYIYIYNFQHLPVSQPLRASPCGFLSGCSAAAFADAFLDPATAAQDGGFIKWHNKGLKWSQTMAFLPETPFHKRKQKTKNFKKHHLLNKIQQALHLFDDNGFSRHTLLLLNLSPAGVSLGCGAAASAFGFAAALPAASFSSPQTTHFKPIRWLLHTYNINIYQLISYTPTISYIPLPFSFIFYQKSQADVNSNFQYIYIYL